MRLHHASRAAIWTVVAITSLLAAACEDVTESKLSTDTLAADGSGDQGRDVSDGTLAHRVAASACDGVRSTVEPVIDFPDAASCAVHADCTEGVNGRCIGNSHDGWYCTYDECSADVTCGGFVCECEGGFRSDHDVCLHEGNCLTDADCGAGGFCSPTLGDCGAYSGTVGYYCHTPADDCVEDADCNGTGAGWGPYCAYNKLVGRWMCSESHCVG